MVADIFIVTATVSKHQRLDFRAFSASSIFQGVEERLFQCWSNPANLKLHSRSKFYDSHTFYKWLILEFREITVSNPGEKCKICLGITSVEPRSCWWHRRYFSEVMKSSKCQGCQNDLWSGSSFFWDWSHLSGGQSFRKTSIVQPCVVLFSCPSSSMPTL